MEALLILGGMVALAVSWAWLVFASLSLGPGPLMVATLLPVITPLLRGRGYPVLPRVLLVIALVSVVAGVGLLYRDQPERFDRLLSGNWAETPASAALSGTLMGQPFVPDNVYWRGDQLIFAETAANRTLRSLVVRFDKAPALLHGTAIDLLPGDDGPWPELVIQWYTGALTAPGLRRIPSAYSLSIALAPVGASKTEMTVYLHLPADHATRLGGRVLLDGQPDWLGKSLSAPAPAPVEPPPVAVEPAGWRELNLQTLLDSPARFIGRSARVLTVTGRSYEGVLKEVTGDRRIVLSLPQGANQVDFQFHPEDVVLIETRARR
ncbi:hypothetical protein GCM10007421_24670 [Halopseudomonas oceani]|uniref:Uncharacterized protein n=1 Tax=Halopseudomonas oceani TaxID=1708783 RepID=A0A2P4EUR0_9GAMM|nr:hypothetical protein [Halopseudomonas oceani]POB03193.1 hypothetical protein C1949_10910 [Halopseudomonas oceani]GGE49486.1 hypothetical protein GCM10007421_24670 [Halopseudomonas oceani]